VIRQLREGTTKAMVCKTGRIMCTVDAIGDRLSNPDYICLAYKHKFKASRFATSHNEHFRFERPTRQKRPARRMVKKGYSSVAKILLSYHLEYVYMVLYMLDIKPGVDWGSGCCGTWRMNHWWLWTLVGNSIVKDPVPLHSPLFPSPSHHTNQTLTTPSPTIHRAHAIPTSLKG
jgi:hypothetical protein